MSNIKQLRDKDKEILLLCRLPECMSFIYTQISKPSYYWETATVINFLKSIPGIGKSSIEFILKDLIDKNTAMKDLTVNQKIIMAERIEKVKANISRFVRP